jgi:general stress protein CsbA
MIMRTAVTAGVGIGAILAAVILFSSTYQRSENAFWIAFVVALIGFGLLILCFIDSIRRPEENHEAKSVGGGGGHSYAYPTT